MKRTRLVLILVIAAATIASGAGANGSAYSPGLVYGWSGVGAGRHNEGVRYVAFGMPKSTIVAAVRARDGRVLKSKVVTGFYGVPLVAYDGTSGGLSGDGKSLVLGSYGPFPGRSGKTRFVLLSTETLAVRREIVLDGLVVVRRDLTRCGHPLPHAAPASGRQAALPRSYLRDAGRTAPRRDRRPARG